jgi:hypothetical protein
MQTFFRLFTALAAIALLLAPPVATAQEAKKAAAKADARQGRSCTARILRFHARSAGAGPARLAGTPRGDPS